MANLVGVGLEVDVCLHQEDIVDLVFAPGRPRRRDVVDLFQDIYTHAGRRGGLRTNIGGSQGTN